MRWAALLAVVLANAGFASEPARVSAVKQRAARTVETTTFDGWKATRDRDTGAIVSLWGKSISVPGSIASGAIAEAAARELAGKLAPDLVVVSNRVERGQRTVVFQQTIDGLRVIGAQVFVVFAHDRMFAAGSSAVPVSKISNTAARAGVAKTEAWLRAAGIEARLTLADRAVLPIIDRGSISLEVVDVIEAHAGLERWNVYVSADGTPIERVSKVAHGSGTVRMDVPVRHPLGSRTKLAASRTNMIVDGIPLVSSFGGGVTWNGSAAAAVTPSVNGEIVRVIDAKGSPAGGTVFLANNGTVDWSFATSGDLDAQLTAFAWATVAKSRARIIHPSLAWLDQRLTITVNEPGSCNALSDGDSLHFFGAGACENAARVVDVVLHEFGHSFHTQSHLASGADFALGEGLADFFAANITGDSGIGRGLNFNDNAVRDLEPDLVFPEDLSGDEHITGLIVGGALWDLRKQLPSEIERIYLGIVEHATDLSNVYVGALIGDDDDGDLGNGTPHQCAIEQAFAAHGLVPGFETTALATPSIDGRVVTVEVDVPAATCARPRVTGVELVVQIGDTLETSAMTGDGSKFIGTLPELVGPQVIRYQVIASLDDGSQLAMPNNAGDPMYQLMIGSATPLFCDPLDADPKWIQGGRMGWELARPLGRAGDPAVAFTGDTVLGTNLKGSGRYPAGSSSITMPAVDTLGFSDVHLQFYRWLTIEERTKDRAAISLAGNPIFVNSIGDGLDHVDREWRFVDLPLSASGEITWSIDANSQAELGGWNLDDVCIVTFDPEACVGDCEPPAMTDGGCCSSSGSSSSLLLGVGVLGLLLRRRRR